MDQRVDGLEIQFWLEVNGYLPLDLIDSKILCVNIQDFSQALDSIKKTLSPEKHARF
jgi:hypothetical protein